MQRLTSLSVVLLLLVAACGGDSTDDSDSADQPTATQPADDSGDEPAAAQPADDSGDEAAAAQPADDSGDEAAAAQPADDSADSDDSGGEGPSTATVTIGDETYEFSSADSPVAQCLPDLFGIMAVNLPLADGGDGRIEIIALHEGTDPVEVEQTNRVHVNIGDFDWWADPLENSLGPDESALSGVESVDVDGNSLTGTASFVGRDLTVREWMSMTGTFEATCGAPRAS